MIFGWIIFNFTTHILSDMDRAERMFHVLGTYIFLTEMAERLLFVFFPMFMIDKGLKPV